MKDILLLLAVMISGYVFSQKMSPALYDSISSRYNDYYTLGNLKISDDGRYASVKRWYKGSRDTMLVTDLQNPGQPLLQLIRKNQYFSFFANNRILASGAGEAELINLPGLKRKKFSNVRSVGLLKDLNFYLIVNNDGKLTIYDKKDQLISEFSHVKKVLTDEKKCAYVIRDNRSNMEIVGFSGKESKILYATGSAVKNIELSDSEQYLAVTEISQESEEVNITFINTATGKLFKFILDSTIDFSRVKVWESADNSGFLIDVQKKMQNETVVPEVWYANDGNLKAKEEEFLVRHQYYYWNPESAGLVTVPSDHFPMYAPMNSNRYLLAFNPYKDYQYDTRFAVLDIYLYDMATGEYKPIFTQSEDLMISPKGRFLLSYNHLKKQWEGRDILSEKDFSLAEHLKSRPVFDKDDENVFFESKKGLWKLDLQTQQLKVVPGTEQGASSVRDFERFYVSDVGTINGYYLGKEKTVFLRIRDDQNRSKWMVYSRNKFSEIVPMTTNNITDLKIDSKGKHVYTVEENYNLASRLVYLNSSLRGKKKIMDFGNTKDRKAALIRQEIISYSDSQGNALKGILYYPSGYNKAERYPLIVSIYQIQSTTSNEYRFSGGSTIGFDLRALLDRGYFVYLPDIVYSNTGSGVSALDCVDHALNALESHENIDHQKIGLTGHSMGGYETIFIATQSRRFAAYIAGAAQSDVVRAYFSFNYSSGMPYMWQFENGQHFMNVPFASNKELYFKNNPIHYVDQVNAPILLWTGKKDENVRWDHTMEFFMGLMRNKKQAIALFYPNGYHNLGDHTEESKDLNRRNLEWWDYFLKGKNDIPWINKQMKKDAD